MKDNKTDLWNSAPQVTEYNLPTRCPKCYETLELLNIKLGIFPYQFTDCHFHCTHCNETYNFCFPYHPIMTAGIHTYNNNQIVITEMEEHKCPFHNTTMTPLRIYGDLVYKDTTTKIHLKCPRCYYYKKIDQNTKNLNKN